MRRTLFALAVAASFGLATLARAEVSVKLVRVEESRVRQVLQDEEQDTWVSHVRLVLRLEGPELAGATEFGRLKVTEATDDTGASLKPEQSAGDAGFFMPVQRRMSLGNVERNDGPVEVSISLPAPQRKATRITRVRGEFQVKAGGETKDVTIPRVKELVGKSVDHAALKAAKLTVSVLDAKAAAKAGDDFELGIPFGGGRDALSVKIVGNNDVVKSVDVVGADGQSISPGRFTAGSDNVTVYTLTLERALDATMSLKIELLTGQKIVRVPLDLRDVPLP